MNGALLEAGTLKAVVTISGGPGSGKTTIAMQLARRLGLRYWSCGAFFRRLANEEGLNLEQFHKLAERDHSFDRATDRAAVREAERSSVVLDGHLAGWIAGKHATLKVFLTAPRAVRARRIAERDGISYRGALREIRTRQESNRKRYMSLYKSNVEDLSLYDVVLNTQTWSQEQVLEILKFALGQKLATSTESVESLGSHRSRADLREKQRARIRKALRRSRSNR